jgi:hypothetical protein
MGIAIKLHRIIGIASIVLAAAASYGREARATTFTTDESDLWWNPNESGWGLQVVQTGSVIFVTMFVYDQNNNPLWYTATCTYQGNHVWSGDLYQTSGPWFGAVPSLVALLQMLRVALG